MIKPERMLEYPSRIHRPCQDWKLAMKSDRIESLMRYGTRIFLGVILFLFLSLSPPSFGKPTDAPLSWKVAMTVEVRGEYKMESREATVTGTYAFTFRWSGTMERDDEDYLLVHNKCDLAKWEVEEKAEARGSISVLTADDYPAKPELRVNYILKMEDGLHVDFAVEGFEVPQNPSSDIFDLCLPASEENAAHIGGINYNLFVKTGSNKVIMDEGQILSGPAEKAFAWTWKYQTWVQKQELMIFESSSHETKVKMKIMPADETYRKPAAAARG